MALEKGKTTGLTPEEFTVRAIKTLRKYGSKGELLEKPFTAIHSVFSGFNTAYREEFEEDPILAQKRLELAGVIATNATKGGARLYLPEDAPRTTEKIIGLIVKG